MAKELTSVSLLEKLRLGPADQAWHEFVSIYSGLIDAWLFRQEVSRGDADDIRQEVMAVLVREIPKFDHNGRPGAFRNWLRTLTANRIREFWRARKRHGSGGGPDFASIAMQLNDATSDLSRIWNEEHDQYVLYRLLGKVAKDFKHESMKAFEMVVIEQQPIDRTAKELGLSINAIRIAQSRILRALRSAAQGLID